VSANVDRGPCVSGCMDGVGAVVDGGVNVSVGGVDGVGTVADRGMAHAWAHTFAVVEVASGFACLPDHLPPV
jgi:hypothetical protein